MLDLDFFSFLYRAGQQLIELGKVLYNFLIMRVELPGWLLWGLRLIFPSFNITGLDMWAILGGGGIVILIIWSIFR